MNVLLRWMVVVCAGLGLMWTAIACGTEVPVTEFGLPDSSGSSETTSVTENPAGEQEPAAGKEAGPESTVGPEPTTGPEPTVGPEPTTGPEAGPEPTVGPETGPEPTVGPEAGPEPGPEPQPEPPPAAVDYTQPGPLQVSDLSKITHNAPSSTGCGPRFCTVFLQVTIPAAGQGTRQAPYPLAIISNGFQLNATQYKSYATALAKWGYVVVRWDTNQESVLSYIKHDVLGKILASLIDWADLENKGTGALKGLIDTSKVVMIGHSRGGKAGALAAQADARVVAYFGIDPVDSNPPFTSGGPSAVKGMANTKAAIAVVGADKSAGGLQPCAPTADNYEKFYNASSSPAWEILLKDVGHMQFLDSRQGCLTCLACAAGSAPDAEVRTITQTAMIAWSERATRQANISTYLTGSWLQGWQQKGRLQSRNK
ncbi:MAG: hypothetical protein EP343_23770 [Deltaproteobacteria bacterium]|nr:MAG: hypothetical protein EP343_23770 [Deltaproteobacteria bacterium]